MRTSKGAAFLASAFSLLLGTPAGAIDSYVPIVNQLAQTIDTPQGPIFVIWRSLTTCLNTDTTLSLRIANAAVYGPGFSGLQPTCSYLLPPLVGGEADCTISHTWSGPGFLKITADPGVLVSGDVQRLIRLPDCGGTPDGYNTISQGSAPLPVYHSLFPAGSTAVAGPVDLGSLERYCITGPLTRRRRVNVTLFNAGDAIATFDISVQPFVRPYPNPPILEISKTVAPRDVVQINSLPIPLDDSLRYVFGYDVRAWIRITSSQPFLAYVSTIFDDGEPGTNAFTVYEASQSN